MKLQTVSPVELLKPYNLRLSEERGDFFHTLELSAENVPLEICRQLSLTQGPVECRGRLWSIEVHTRIEFHANSLAQGSFHLALSRPIISEAHINALGEV